MTDPFYDLLEKCCLKADNEGVKGTAFFISPNLALTCAHVIPRGLTKNDHIDIFIDGQPSAISATIVDIGRDLDEDYCILKTETYSAADHLLLGNGVFGADTLCGYGYSVTNDEGYHGEGFPGKYGGPSKAVDINRYPHSFHKLVFGQIRPGLSGSPVVNTRTGRCIGIVSTTRDKHSDLGGLLVPSSLLIERLEKAGCDYLPGAVIKGKWDQAVAQYQGLTITGEQKPAVLQFKRYDEAYTCDRREFNVNFDKFYSARAENLMIDHHLIAGPEAHSPIGLAKKLAFENFTKYSKGGERYPGDPHKPSNRREDVTISYGSNPKRFLLDLIEVVKEPGNQEDYLQLSLTRLYEKFTEHLNTADYTILNIKVLYPATAKTQKNIHQLVNDFIHTLDVNAQQVRKKIYFFWCFVFEKDSWFDQSPLVIRHYITGKKNAVFFLPLIGRFAVKTAMKKLQTADYLIWPVNQTSSLQKPPAGDINTWIDDLNMTSAYRVVDEKRKTEISSYKGAKEVEQAFLEIIDQFNHPEKK